MKNIALIEFSQGHAECLYSQIQFLKQGGYNVSVVCHKSQKNQVQLFDGVDKFLFLDIKDTYWADLLCVVQLLDFINDNCIHRVVVNTFAGKALKIFLLLNWSIDIFGVVHSVSKLKKKYLMGLLSRRVKGLFLLNDYLLPYCRKSKKKLATFYPIFFPKFKTQNLKVDDHELWVCIPGALEYKRRDYLKLLDLVADDLDRRVRFILLGNGYHAHGDGADFKTRLHGDDRFVLFDTFLPDELFHSYLVSSDLIMPLNGSLEKYQTDCISGAINLAFSYKIPMIVEEVYRNCDDFEVSSYFYNDDLVKLLNYLCEHRELIIEKKELIGSFPKFSFVYQSEKYLTFIDSN